jgi:hypothetical protein
MSAVRISIVTISKDDAPGLERTLASIARQALAPAEVVVVRAGSSTISTAALPLPLVDLADPGRGISAAFNLALGRCRGDWVVFLNGGDCFSDADSLGRLAALSDRADRPEIVSGFARTSGGATIPPQPPRRLADCLFLSHQASAFRRGLFDEIGPYAEDFRVRMDLDWLARYLAVRGAGRIAFSPETLVDYQPGGISSRSLIAFHVEEFRVLARRPAFFPALAGLLCWRLPARMALEALQLARRGTAPR